MKEKLVLHKDRFFDPEPQQRCIARELYESVKDLPIVCPHGHVDPAIFAANSQFPGPAELILIPDHYIFRLLYSQGIQLGELGIKTKDGEVQETDYRKIWRTFAGKYYLFAGTPTGAWLDYEFSNVFGITVKLNADTADEIYDQIEEKLSSPEFLPRAMFDRFNIEVLTTTDAAEDSLQYHQAIRDSGWKGIILPCFRPDSVTNLTLSNWRNNITRLEEASGMNITSYSSFIRALEVRREFFKSMGAVSTDQGVQSPYAHRLSVAEAENIFGRALAGQSNDDDAAMFTAHMLMEMTRMSLDDGLVMQIHPGSFRNHNDYIFEKFGPDKGCDIPVLTEYTHNLHELLNTYGNEPRLKLILFTLDESTYSRELAPLAGHYPALKLGPPWWFHDSIEGMTRFRKCVTETAGIYNTAGFNDDTRAFPSIPARHDLARRVDCNYLAGLVARHIVDKSDALEMSRELAYGLVKNAYNL